MFYILGQVLENVWGPFRLLKAHSFLMVIGLYAGFFLCYWILPRFFGLLPSDRGKEIAVQGAVSKGKPTGAGIVFIPIFILVAFLVVPFTLESSVLLCLIGLVALSGYLDDKSTREWGEYLKGVIDLGLAAAASVVMSLNTEHLTMWLPFVNSFSVPQWAFILISTILIWVAINTTNCSDGVDGLSGTLVLIALVSLGILQYFVLGNKEVSSYLLLPHYENGAVQAISAITLAGVLSAYLWYNAYPSRVLMGDAGSRALGFFVGVSVMMTGNPVLLLVIASVLLVNGGTGLIKVALLRFLKIRIFHNTRFPLHDHVRQTRQWSNPQVLLKFAIIQILVTIGLFGIFLKIR